MMLNLTTIFRTCSILKIFVATAFLFILISSSNAASITSSNSGGSWGSASTWIGGVVPGVNDDVIINSNVILNAGSTYTVTSVFIDNGKKLTVNGTLIVNGNLSMHTNGDFSVESGAVVIVKGNVLSGNNTVYSLSSYFIVYGDLSIRNGGQAALNILNAHIYVLGNVSSSNPDFKACDIYGGTTSNTTADCDAGTFEALITNPTPDPIITGIIQQTITDNTKSINNLTPVSSCFCTGGSVVLTIGDTTTPTGVSIVKWYQGTSLSTTQTSPTKPYTYTVTQAGIYSALYKIGNTWFQTNTVTVTSTPIPTATISGSTTICQGNSATLSILLGGTGPWNFTYTDGTTPVAVTGQTTSLYIVNVSPSSTKTYTLNTVSNSCCTGTKSGSATITVGALVHTNPITKQ